MLHITVAVPVFNRAHLVGRTIESILKQDYQDYDMLIVDDASTDDTVDVVKQYAEKDSRIKLIVNETNLGLTRNWNKCLQLAQGPLIQILLSDDLVDSDYLRKVAELFDSQPSVGFVAASCRYINARDEVIQEGTALPPMLYTAGDEAVGALLDGGYPHVSSLVFRKKCFDVLGGFDERIWHGPDVELDARIAQYYDFYHFGEICTSFRRHGTNMGALEYLRDDFLDIDFLKFKMSWERLSEQALRARGITDLGRFVARRIARSALTGVPLAIVYGRSALAVAYLRKALHFDRYVLLARQFWKCVAMIALTPITRAIMRRRMGISAMDYDVTMKVRRSLGGIR